MIQLKNQIHLKVQIYGMKKNVFLHHILNI